MASLAGAWTALVAGFGGMRVQHSSLSFMPRLPDVLKRLAFHLMFQGRRLRVELAKGAENHIPSARRPTTKNMVIMAKKYSYPCPTRSPVLFHLSSLARGTPTLLDVNHLHGGRKCSRDTRMSG